VLATDHFEVRSLRRSNPLTSEPPDWRFRMRILSPAGVSVNYSTVKNMAGDERELNQGDAFTVGSSPSVGSGSGGASGTLHGLHFTFIPLLGAALLPERPRELPELEPFRQADDIFSGPVVESVSSEAGARHQRSHRANSLPNALLASKAGALKPPTSVVSMEQSESEPGLDSPSEQLFGAQRSRDGFSKGESASEDFPKTRALESIFDDGPGGDPDDLFSRTGFRLSGASCGSSRH